MGDDGDYFFIDQILDHRPDKTRKKNKQQFLIRWEGYGSEHDSWEPEEEIKKSEEGETLNHYWEYVRNTAPHRIPTAVP